ncbi:NfeD family protein [Leptothoe sp. PORK10 BA2]|uniref:NfeD family protein n=1 Tax=Leptothoe sp. PORK10 BA2 TaxID=3110254 RepID=UPI002B2036E5|nr:hypothetical protein [Leptothoe sp. PORK10 BA2]MEA5462203.1 hypothetical protein [Leptothoe sp. PORK10 BA2]
MVGCQRTSLRYKYLSPAPMYFPWLDDDQSEHEAVIEDVLKPGKAWRVRYKASFWKACSNHADLDLLPQDTVHVIGRQNLTLIIQAPQGSAFSSITPHTIR